jgi:hypothetical protein
MDPRPGLNMCFAYAFARGFVTVVVASQIRAMIALPAFASDLGD